MISRHEKDKNVKRAVITNYSKKKNYDSSKTKPSKIQSKTEVVQWGAESGQLCAAAERGEAAEKLCKVCYDEQKRKLFNI